MMAALLVIRANMELTSPSREASCLTVVCTLNFLGDEVNPKIGGRAKILRSEATSHSLQHYYALGAVL